MGLLNLGPLHYRTVFDKTKHKRNHYLAESNQEAFLTLAKANAELRKAYAAKGLRDYKGVQRVVRVVTIAAGTKIYKLTGGLEKQEKGGPPLKPSLLLNNLVAEEILFKYDTITPWWAPVLNFEEDQGGIREHFKNMVFNATALPGPGQLTLREYGRFMSAVMLEWNKLNYYVELKLKKDVQAYWGQFEEQAATTNLDLFTGASTKPVGWGWTGDEQVKIEVVGGDKFIIYKGEESVRYYLPDFLGGLEAWQFFIPGFEKSDVDPLSVQVLPTTDSKGLAKYFGCSYIFDEAKLQVGRFKPPKP